MDDYTYDACCSMCEQEVTVIVHSEDERPLFCPMCGSEIAEDYLEKD